MCYDVGSVNLNNYFQIIQVSADDFIEEKELGRGAFGSVYQMRHKGTNVLMAVKVSLQLWCVPS